MPNNGIISRYATVPEEFKVNTTTEFDNTTDTIVVNKALNGIKVEQKAITLNQLAGMVGGGSQGPQGVQGPQGPAGPTSPAGLNWIGGWQTGVTYYLNDVVTYVDPSTDIIGSYWVNVESISDNTPPCDASGDVNTPQWAFLASQGPQGIQGPEGPQGIQGPQGPAGVATLPYKEINFSVTPYDDSTGMNPNIVVGYSTFDGGIVSASQYGFIYIEFINETDYISSPQKCIITTQTPVSYGNQFNFIINSEVNSPYNVSSGITLRTLRQPMGTNNGFSSHTTPGVTIYVNIRVYN